VSTRVTHKLSVGIVLLFSIMALTALAIPGAEFQNATEKPEVFDVASVKPVAANAGPGRPGMFMNFGAGCAFGGLQIDPRRFVITATLQMLVALAHDGNCRVPDLISGGPDWVTSDRFDIEAVMPEGFPTYTPVQFSNGNAPRLQAMVRTLLADRFKLMLHRETKDVTLNVLTVGKAGPKLTPANDADQSVRRINLRKDAEGKQYLEFVAGKATSTTLAEMLQLATKRPVVDRTGLTGQYNVRVEYDNDGLARPTIFTVLQEELGLRLESAKDKMDVIVIDRAEKPSVN
jgi:uncharacterized protein (TIGR03435 family)